MMERAGKDIKRVIIIAAAALFALCMAGIIMVWAGNGTEDKNPLFKTVLGKGVNFGIIANDFQHNNDLQSNFAVKTYTGSGHGVNPNLSGKNPGNFVIGSITNKVQVTKGASKDSTFFVTKDDASKIDDSQNKDVGNHATINTSYTKDQLDSYVNSLINGALDQGGTWANQKATYTKSTDQNHYGDIDTTKYPSDATIYINGDDFRNELSQTGKIHITKLENQDIVFNFTKTVEGYNWQTKQNEVTTSLDLGQFQITVGSNTFTTAPSSDPNEQNVQLSQQAKHIFFNVRPSSGIKNVSFTNTAGIFLIKGASASVSGTSSGWIVTDGTFSNPNGEWHNIYQDTENTVPDKPTQPAEKGTLVIEKTSEGATTPADTTFTITGPNDYNQTVKYSEFTDGKYKLDGLAVGDYTVTEDADSAKVDNYTLTVTGDNSVAKKVEDKQTTTAAITNTYTEQQGALEIEKTTKGGTTPADTEFTITGPNKYSRTVKYSEFGKDGKYTVKDLTPGEYTVTEDTDSAKVDNYTLTVTGDNSVAKKVEDKQTTTAAITNTYTEQQGALEIKKTTEGGTTPADTEFTITGPNKYSRTVKYSEFGKDGKYTVKDLTPGEYKVTENVDSAKVDNYTLTVTGDNSVAKKVEDSKTTTAAITNTYDKKEEKGSLKLTKTSVGHATPDNATFTITGPNYSKTVKYSELKDGTITLSDLATGTYNVKESNANVVDYQVAVSGNTEAKVSKGQQANITLTNTYTKEQPVKGALRLLKQSKDGTAIAGTTYTLYKWNGTDNSKIGTVTRDQIENTDKAAWTQKDQNVTDESGAYTSPQLDAGGTYAIMETEATDGYQRTANPAVFTVTDKGAISLIQKSNADGAAELDKDGNVVWYETSVVLKVTKVDQNGQPVKGATLALFDGDKEIEHWITDGKAHQIAASLTAGKNYTLKEIDVPAGYEKAPDQIIPVEKVDVKGKDANIQSASMTDKKTTTSKAYSLKMRKMANINQNDTDTRIANSKYSLFKWTGKTNTSSADPDKAFKGLTRKQMTEANGWKEIVSSDTDANGEIKADSASNTDITPGIYAIMEQTPPAGYQRTANPAIIRLNEDGSKTRITMISNANGAAVLEKEGTGDAAVQFLRWRETATNVEIAKVDENGKPVKDAILAVYDKDGKFIESWTTDGTAHRITAKLIAGDTYTLKELKAPEGYEKAADETFKVEEKDIVGIDQYVQDGINMTDKKTTTTTTTTNNNKTQTIAQGVKTGDPTTIGGLIAMIAAAGGIAVLSIKRLREAK